MTGFEGTITEKVEIKVQSIFQECEKIFNEVLYDYLLKLSKVYNN